MENAAHPVVLGMDWIGKAEAVIYVENEKPVVDVAKSYKKMLSSSAKREKEEVVGDIASNEKTEPELVEGKVENASIETSDSFEKAADQLLSLGAMVGDEVIIPKREQKTCIRLKGAKRIVESRVQFIEAPTPGRVDGLWLIETTRSTRLNKEWVTPSCLLESHGGKVFIPIVNLSKKTVKLRGP
uniref:Uncharacterized protein n=1 Tax=Daphnia galeata TaxID=27404 RepID=A0A8J2RPS5_9CRUS|nr:unnamed protein product [Daphnia galeata]